MRIIKKIDKPTVVIIGIIAIFLLFIGSMIHYGNQYVEHKYSLSEMNNGVYAIYYNTHSTVPADNYEVVTLCCEGNIYTFNGSVYISFTDSKPYVKVKNYNMVNGDEIYVYVPQGTVNYEESVNIGR